jgi:integrase/recombinase XerD
VAAKQAPKLATIPGDPADVRGFPALVAGFIEWMRVTNYSERTVEGRMLALAYFAAFLLERGISRPVEVTRPIIERYQRHLYHARKKDGQPLSFRYQHGRLTPVRAFFKWLSRQRHILANPASELDLPKLERRLPRHVLNIQEVEQVMAGADPATPHGLRDRAILEVLYSTGIRRTELVNLALYDIDAERGTLMVRQGKGKKDRMIPIGDRALAWLDKYLIEVRPTLAPAPDPGVLFLTAQGEAFTPNRLTQLARDYVAAANLGKAGACHLFRHTMATLMLENGADIRFIQQMLGHAELSTTEIYTQVSIRALKEVHARTHPAKLERSAAGPAAPAAAPAPPAAAAASTAPSAAEVLAALDHEADEEDAESA